jgi:ectoine hydroxylase-related dioxygenase (phytanoyl-CoA dioxygenase family)
VIDVHAYDREGFVVAPGFVRAEDAAALLNDAITLARRAAAGESVAPAFVTPEANLADRHCAQPEDAVSKIFRMHRIGSFHALARRQDLVEDVASLLGTEDVDCFGSQFIFKNPGAWGQPCHQDSYYFPFEPARPVLGVWVAVTEATLDNGCLSVVPHSNTEPVHEHVPDRRPNANLGYFEIVDHDLSSAVPVVMEPGDVLFFDSHLMHFSTDNCSRRPRAAMVYHYAPAGIVDHAVEHFGFTIHDWMPVRREGSPLSDSPPSGGASQEASGATPRS